jgi:hypothetical protein
MISGILPWRSVLWDFISKIIFGLLLRDLQQSLSDHPLKKSIYFLFPTGEDL